MIIFLCGSLRKVLRVKYFQLLLLAFSISFSSRAQFATEIYTDFGGFWRSSQTTFNTVLPNKSHNVLAFSYGGITYSTDVNNSTLSDHGVSFTPGHYQTLPFTSLAGTVPTNNNAIYIALADEVDGVSSGFSNPVPSIKPKVALTDGINGLNIGTGVTNLPSSAGMLFPAQIISNSAITDNQPDIIYAQLTDAASSADVLVFQDAQGRTVGKSNSIQWNIVKAIGSQKIDFYNLTGGDALDNATIAGGYTSMTTENLRLATFKLSDFGITTANASEVKALVIKPAGSSDPAFIAYNTDGIYIIPPNINTQPLSQVVCNNSGQSATFSVDATGINLTYQWLKDGISIPGATNATYAIPSVSAGDVGGYQVIVTNQGGTQYSTTAYLNITINRQPSPAAQSIVTGNKISYSVSASNATSFQWKRNGIDIAGATDSVYTFNPVTTSDGGSYTVTVINSGGNGCANMVSTPVNLTPVIVVYSKTTTEINVASAWGANVDGSGSTPVDFTRAEHTFVLSNRDSGNTLTNMTIAGTLDVKNGVAIIAANTTLDVGKCIRTGTGSITGSVSAGLTIRGNSDLYFTPGSQLLKNFTIAGGTVNMLSPLTISGGTLPGKLNLVNGTLALENNKITLQSTSTTNTSMVTAVGATASITYGTDGAFIVERFVPAKRAYRFISPAVTSNNSIKSNWMEGVVNPDRWTNYNPQPGYGTHITGPKTAADSLDVTQSYNPSLFTFDINTQLWTPVLNSSATLSAGTPYRLMVRGSRAVDLNDNEAVSSNTIIRSTGKLTIGNYSVGSSLLSTKPGSYSYIGNPYASPVNWLTLTRSGISNSYYSWDATLGRRGAYVAYNGISGTNDKPASLIDENIQSEQAFFVQSTSATPSIIFTETNKSTNNTKMFRTADRLTKLTVQLLLGLNEGSQNVADGFTAVYSDNFSAAIGEEDAGKIPNLDENIAVDGDKLFSIEGRPAITKPDTLDIRMWQFRQKDYWLKIEGRNFNPAVKAIVRDAYLREEFAVDLNSSTIIPFTITADSASFAAGRFSILYDYQLPPAPAFTSLQANHKDKGIIVTWQTGAETNISNYEVEKSVNNKKFNLLYRIPAIGDNSQPHNYDWFDEKSSNSSNNFYRIKIIEKNGSTSYSEVVRVITNNDNGSAIAGSRLVQEELQAQQLPKTPAGKYRINIFSNTGHLVYNGQVAYNTDASLQMLLTRLKIPAAMYIVQMVVASQIISRSIILQ